MGLDLAKNSFQLHGASADGAVVFRKELSRSQLLKFLAAQPKCIVATEACASAHHWEAGAGLDQIAIGGRWKSLEMPRRYSDPANSAKRSAHNIKGVGL